MCVCVSLSLSLSLSQTHILDLPKLDDEHQKNHMDMVTGLCNFIFFPRNSTRRKIKKKKQQQKHDNEIVPGKKTNRSKTKKKKKTLRLKKKQVKRQAHEIINTLREKMKTSTKRQNNGMRKGTTPCEKGNAMRTPLSKKSSFRRLSFFGLRVSCFRCFVFPRGFLLHCASSILSLHTCTRGPPVFSSKK